MMDCAAPASVGLPSLPLKSSEKATSRRAPNAYTIPNSIICQYARRFKGKLWHTIINDMTKSVPKMAMTMKTARSERFVITRHSAVVCT